MSNKLIIRQATEADIEEILLFEFRNREWFAQYFPTQALCRQTEMHFKRLLRGRFSALHYLVFLHDEALIGRFTGQVLDEKKHSLEISYRVEKTYTNQGVARYVLRRLLLIWACLGIKEVYANVADHNQASAKVLTSCGFEMTGVEEKALKLNSGIHDCLIFKWVSIGD
ncbi:GNAT family N-acetyltransferase [Marinomonas transparens]|uniref:GNAT family N-acetyltransferase n=1 Tax=Marinomonas transparens TaxID=2795388 RepID=A0A934JLV9_9GAMM|nr:GNAT family N-acetyltransferase [Marinomonas transparens]MBJ7538201.1 GNAT family N-acetyltransferase [Marinomonas transparens]